MINMAKVCYIKNSIMVNFTDFFNSVYDTACERRRVFGR